MRLYGIYCYWCPIPSLADVIVAITFLDSAEGWLIKCVGDVFRL